MLKITNKMENHKHREEIAIALDFLPNGYPFDKTPSHKKNSIVQAIGKDYYTLLELVPKKEIAIAIGDEIYIGEGKRDKIHHILGRLDPSKLTKTAESEMKIIIEKLIDVNHQKFIDFFNNSQPLTTRMHQLELLPGLGKKHMWEIIDERKFEPFKSFEDIKKRIKLMPDPKKIIINRILKEILGNEKHHIFTG